MIVKLSIDPSNFMKVGYVKWTSTNENFATEHLIFGKSSNERNFQVAAIEYSDEIQTWAFENLDYKLTIFEAEAYDDEFEWWTNFNSGIDMMLFKMRWL